MKKWIFSIVGLLCVSLSFAQELQAEVMLNTQQVNQTNKQVFQTLKTALKEFLNTTHWTNQKVLTSERIQCNFIFTINSYDSGLFSADLQVQSVRPVYGTSYNTMLLNYKDTEVDFSYQEFEPLIYNPDQFTSNLISIVAFYVQMILGWDADSFALNGGKPYFEQAQRIVIQAQSSDYAGWKQSTDKSRWQLAEDALSSQYDWLHKALYRYHRLGLDTMIQEPKKAKDTIAQSIIDLSNIQGVRVGSFLLQSFFDAKSEEITQIFSEGNSTNYQKLKESLIQMFPSKSSDWAKIK